MQRTSVFGHPASMSPSFGNQTLLSLADPLFPFSALYLWDGAHDPVLTQLECHIPLSLGIDLGLRGNWG